MDSTLSMASLTSTRPHKPHHNDPAHKGGLRAVATIEFSKGIAGISFVLGVLWLLRQDLWDVSFSVLEFFHINPDRRWAQALLDLADRTTDRQLWTVAGILVLYSILRFIEAYGLWKTRVWAEWLAILSGLIYLPFEIRELLHKATPLHWIVLVGNLALVGYVAYVRFSGLRRERRSAHLVSASDDRISPAHSSPEQAYVPDSD
jgi:uncharacterized membrane protein (DUF2068 family)